MPPQLCHGLVYLLEAEDARVWHQCGHEEPRLAAEMRIGVALVRISDDVADESGKGASGIGEGAAVAVARFQRAVARLADADLVLENRYQPAERVPHEREHKPAGRSREDLFACGGGNVEQR